MKINATAVHPCFFIFSSYGKNRSFRVRNKKIPGPTFSRSGDFPFLNPEIIWCFFSSKKTPCVQTGLLTYGSSYLPRLPISIMRETVASTAFVPDHSGGPVPYSQGVPFSALRSTRTIIPLNGEKRKVNRFLNLSFDSIETGGFLNR